MSEPAEDFDRHGPLGFWHLAEDYRRAAVHLSAATAAPQRHLWLRFGDDVSYSLHAHSMELALKAFLRARGTDVKALKHEYGHNLEKLFSDATAAGVALGDSEEHAREVVRWMHDHVRAQSFKYFEKGYRSLPSIADVANTNEALLDATGPACGACPARAP